MRDIDASALRALVSGQHADPFLILGPHPVPFKGGQATAIRTFQPQAESAAVLADGRVLPMERIHPDGIFQAVLPGEPRPTPYRIQVTRHEGSVAAFEDPYRFPPVLSDFDIHLFAEGTHFELYRKLGAHRIQHQGCEGVAFAVWAPNARAVCLVGNFNEWDPRRHPMRHVGHGLWELFVPGVKEGELYKFHIRSQYHGYEATKADPYGFAMEMRPRTASIVWNLDRYQWHDEGWMAGRRRRNALDAPVSIYEVHLGSWRRDPHHHWLTYRALAGELVPYVKEMGYTHIELMPVSEHPFDGSWGYQPVGHFAPSARWGTPDDFRHFVDAAHQAGIGVILDWVPAHFPRDGHGLAYFDGTHLYEHADPRKGEHQDWGTLIYNFGRREVSAFLLTNALFWLDRYHVDGLRVDAVASMIYLDYSRKEGEWIPNRFGGRENLEAIEFVKRFNVVVHERFPDVLTIAEESTAWPMVSRPVYLGGLGFDLKWNMGWMHDMLELMKQDPVYRKYHHDKLTFSLLYAFTENFLLPLSHDEVVHGKGSLLSKMPGDYWRHFANLRALYGYMYGHPGKKLLFMGGEIGQWKEWSHDDQVDWGLLEFDAHRKMRDYVTALNRLYAAEPALHEVDFNWEGFQWIDFHDYEQSIVSFVRRARNRDDFVVVAANLTPVPRPGYRIGVPVGGIYREILNSDAEPFGGSGVLNREDLTASEGMWQGQPWSIALTLPPLGVVFLKLAPAPGEAPAVDILPVETPAPTPPGPPRPEIIPEPPPPPPRSSKKK